MLLRNLMASAGGAPAATTTWNPSDKATNIVLSGSNLIAGRTGSNGYQSVRGTSSQSSGKHYFEVLVGAVTPSSMMIGLASSPANLNSFVGSDTAGFGYNASNGGAYTSNNLNAYGTAWSANDVIGIAWDAGAGKIWFARNGTWQAGGDPGSGTGTAAHTITPGAILFPMASIFEGATGQTFTARFGVASFTQTMPAGYSQWG